MHVQIALFDGFDPLDVIAPFEVLHAGGLYADGALTVELASAEGVREVPSGTVPLSLRAAATLDAGRADVIVVPGASGRVEERTEGDDTIPKILGRTLETRLPDVLREACADPELIVATVCGGSLVLAMAGLVEGRHASPITWEWICSTPPGWSPWTPASSTTETSSPRPASPPVWISDCICSNGSWDRASRTRSRRCSPTSAAAPSGVPVGSNPPSSEERTMSVDGTWNVVIATPVGKQRVELTFVTQDGELRGTARGASEEVPLTDPALDGNRLTWSQSITKPLRLHLQFDVLVEGDEMTGKSTAGRLPSSKVSGRRSVPDR